MKQSHIDYVEFTAGDLNAVKEFYQACFGWKFTDYGETYTAFENSGLAGGFALTDHPVINGALIVLYHEDLEEIKAVIVKAGGQIVREIFSFPGGHRFHFADPAGNELAVWSDK